MKHELFAANTLESFWRPLLATPTTPAEWSAASGAASATFPPAADAAGDEVALATAVLGEGQFGPGHWQLSLPKRLYYCLKPWLPRAAMVALRRSYHYQQFHAEGAGQPDARFPSAGRRMTAMRASNGKPSPILRRRVGSTGSAGSTFGRRRGSSPLS